MEYLKFARDKLEIEIKDNYKHSFVNKYIGSFHSVNSLVPQSKDSPDRQRSDLSPTLDDNNFDLTLLRQKPSYSLDTYSVNDLFDRKKFCKETSLAERIKSGTSASGAGRSIFHPVGKQTH